MTSTQSTGSRLGVLHDTGIPPGSEDYTTLVVLHGHNWHSGTFSKVIPLASINNTRLILVNRRGYPGSTPFTDEELATIPKLTPDANEDTLEDAREELGLFMRDRAREVYDLLEDIVRQDNIPPAQPEKNTGGIILAGWSFGALWMNALMAYVSSFPVNDVELSKYVRRVVIFDTGNLVMGYPGRSDMYERGFDPALSEAERKAAYNVWERARRISSYYSHGETLDSLSDEPLKHPPSTVSTLSAEERANLTHIPGGVVDSAIALPGIQSGLFDSLRQRAISLPSRQDNKENGDDAESSGDDWRDIELRVVWCQMSHAEVSYVTLLLIAELEDAKKKGIPVRNVRVVRVKGANHFIHWDQPEMAMRALLGDEDVI
ncbi:hypothetical protein DICSQDRAFT_169637 [Dichomitus squalens LYAD-421 SS1]|nr:uncharacterized protein DICSQDRAFT_169637 [Dichomitus squalens LYAD-421 SS1]EJF62060.1 hypothetical protein DICSQDRAFT_169637 [Dichomitus squalens LYAD-421 SS1]TBU24594.1 hypothetical protein BD311DRAFT_554072 [Dichomitus squalens]